MEPICGNFSFPNLDNVDQVVAPLLSAKKTPEGGTLVRVMIVTNTDIARGGEPVFTLSNDGTGTVEYETVSSSEPENPNLVWYMEQTISVLVDEVSIKAVDKRLPPQTSRGTVTTVQNNTTIDL